MLSILWNWQVDGVTSDRFDWLGSGIAILGVLVIMFAPIDQTLIALVALAIT